MLRYKVIWILALLCSCHKKEAPETSFVKATLLIYNRGEDVPRKDSSTYQFETLENGEGYLISNYLEGPGNVSVLKCDTNYPDSFEVVFMKHLPTYLHLTDYCNPSKDSWKGHKDFATHYRKETQRTYQIDSTTYTVFTFNLDFIASDAGHRLYFSPQLGPLAAYATSWGNRVEYHIEHQPRHAALLKKVLSDKDFFPRPVDAYPMPPNPE